MLGLALNELAERKRQRVIKAGPQEIKNCSCLPSSPPSTDEVEAEWNVKVPRLKRKAAATLHLMNLQPDRRGHIFTVCLHPGWMLYVKQGHNLLQRHNKVIYSNVNIAGVQSLSDYLLKHVHSFNQSASGAVTLTRE